MSPSDPPPCDPNQASAPKGAPARGPRPLVLVVDDRPEVAGAVADLCRALGVDAAVSVDGEPMRSALLRHRPAAVVVDVMMPDEDGYEALKEIAAVDPFLPVLLITGHGDTWLRMGAVLGRAHGLANVQTARKPIRSTALAEFLASVQTRDGGSATHLPDTPGHAT